MKITTITRRFSTLKRKNSKLNKNNKFKKIVSSTNIKLRDDNNKKFNYNNRLSSIKIDFTCLKKPEYWSTIIYHEYNNNSINNIYHCNTKSIKVYYNKTIELLNNSLINYFSINSLINLSSSIENIRKLIGNGIEFYCDDRDILATNHSSKSIFIQSKNMNYFNKSNDDFIYEIKTGVSIMIFNYSIFQELIFHYLHRDVESISDLLRMCIIKMSFVEGWGINYENKNIENTPCWLEIQLHEPMGIIASILSPIKSSNDKSKQQRSSSHI